MNQPLITRSASALSELLAKGEITSEALTQACLDRIAEVDERVHAFLRVDTEGALAQAREIDRRRAEGETLPPLAGIPVAVKDNIATEGIETTAASRILEGWVPQYDATVVRKLREAGMVIIGKTNLDEFAMGSSTEHSAFGPSRNPWDLDRTPGGSGGGSSAAVASFEVPLALGTDTGGSIRQPAALTGTVGVKPTYGQVSRYGALAMGSSLDQIGPATRTVLDAAMLQDVLGGYDAHDATSIDREWESFTEAAREGQREGSLRGLRVGVPAELVNNEGVSAGVRAQFEAALEQMKTAGAEIVELSTPSFEYAVAAYYVIMPAEVSSNLARYDSVRYGLRVEREGQNVEEVMATTRAQGFGGEVKRRILLGTYVLSTGYYDAYYGSAQKVRTLVQNDIENAFAQVDVLAAPGSPGTAFRFGEKSAPTEMYVQDITTIPANLAGIPALSIPAGLSEEDGLPVGLQFMAPVNEDARLYRVAAGVEKLLETQWGGPLIDRLPLAVASENEGAQ